MDHQKALAVGMGEEVKEVVQSTDDLRRANLDPGVGAYGAPLEGRITTPIIVVDMAPISRPGGPCNRFALGRQLPLSPVPYTPLTLPTIASA